jgi:hypothetical protein
MSSYKICIVGGWCGNRMVMIDEYLNDLLDNKGLPCQITRHSVWENYSTPPPAHLVLQLLPAFTEAETNCPIINIKPLLVDLDHKDTIDRILTHIIDHYPISVDCIRQPSYL